MRQQIRTKIKELLDNISNVNIFEDYPYSISEDKLPFISISSSGEQIEKMSIGTPCVLQRTLTLKIIVCTRAIAGYQNALDTLINQIELQINNNISLDDLVHSAALENINIEVDDESDKPTAFAEISLICNYRTMSNNLDLSI